LKSIPKDEHEPLKEMTMLQDETWYLVDTAYCDEAGRNYLRGWGGCSTGEQLLHECAIALKELADNYADPVSGTEHPLCDLAFHVQAIANSGLGEEQAKALAVFVRKLWRLDKNQLMMLARWSQLLGLAIQQRKQP